MLPAAREALDAAQRLYKLCPLSAQCREKRRAHRHTPAVRAGQPQTEPWAARQRHAHMPSTSPRTETLRRARLYGCSTRDPLLRKIEAEEARTASIPEQKPAPEPVPADLHESSSPTTTSERNRGQ